MKKILNIVTSVFSGIAIIFFLFYMKNIILNINFKDFLKNIFTNYKGLILILLIFLCIHIFRLFRIYILLIEKKIKIRELLPIYLSTTIVNNIFPFKSGEIYKALLYGKSLNNLGDGILIVWIDRFFDTCIICIPMLFSILKGNINLISIIIYLFVIISIIIYCTFSNTYKYLNKLLLTNGKTKKTVFYLKVLNKANDFYINSNKLIRGRGVILLFLSLFIWLFEYLFIFMITNVLNVVYKTSDFILYLNQSFLTTNNSIIFSNIVILSTIILFCILVITCIIKLVNKKIKGCESNE